jgi:hypothetical protein
VLALLGGFLLLEMKKERRRKKFASLFILLLKFFFFLLLNKIWRYFFSRNCGKNEFPSVLSARLRKEL